MLPINIDNLSSYLKPDIGYRFDRGLSTTYSLHLDILLTLPMFLDGRFSEKNAVMQNYGGVVSTINSFRDSFKIYVQKGEIKTSSLGSKKASKLYELLRPMICEIDKDTTKSSFHPKLWLLRYETEDKNIKKYKLIVLSKNLTNSSDLDIAVVFDGSVVENSPHQEINKNLNYFCQNILENDTFTLNELKNIKWIDVNGYELTNLYIFPKNKNRLPFFNKGVLDKKVIVFSPFISNNIFQENNRNILVTREVEVKEQVAQNIYFINSSIEIEEEKEEENLEFFEGEECDDSHIFINQLHSKIYIYTRDNRNWLTFGSANATNRGFRSNDEVLIELKAPKNFYNDMKDYIENNKLFIECLEGDIDTTLEDEKEKISDELDDIKRDILNQEISVKYKNRTLSLSTDMNSSQDDISIFITPISLNSFKKLDDKSCYFWKVGKTEITGWFRVKLTKDNETKEFLMEDKNFQLSKEYLLEIEQEANDKSEAFLEANILALLKDGKITEKRNREELIFDKDEKNDFHNYCVSEISGENIYDLMLERYVSNKKDYKIVLSLLQKNDKYKELLQILPKVK